MSRIGETLLVLGVGNVLLRDDGVGVHAVIAVRAAAERGSLVLPQGTSLVDGGTLGRDLLPLLADARALLLVDAVVDGRRPGTVTVAHDAELRDRRPRDVAVLRVGVDDLLDAAGVAGTLPDAVSFVGVSVADIDVGLELSEVVREALPATMDVVVEELHRLDAISGPGSGSTRGAYEVTGAMA